jgi:spore maturation protein CgeB
MTKKIVFIDSFYFDVIQKLTTNWLQESPKTYSEAIKQVELFGFGTGSSYVGAFRRAGWDAHLIVPNFWKIQALWCKENGFRSPLSKFWKFMQVFSRIPIFPIYLERLPYFYSVLLNQVKDISPDVVIVQDLHCLHPHFVDELKKIAPFVYGEIASPLPPERFLKKYSRIISALPSIVQRSKELGIPSSFLPLAYDTKFAAVKQFDKRSNDVVFVGTFGRHQPKTIPLLQSIYEKNPGLRIYGNVDQAILEEAGLIKCFAGQAWGTEMFDVLSDSKIVINRHGTIAQNYSVNMRMYEATGSGAVLVTEDSVNISELFEPGQEVCTYADNDDAATIIQQLLADSIKMEHIAKQGRDRTLKSHSYDQRVAELSKIILDDFDKHLAG